jgi:hypothetical protein
LRQTLQQRVQHRQNVSTKATNYTESTKATDYTESTKADALLQLHSSMLVAKPLLLTAQVKFKFSEAHQTQSALHASASYAQIISVMQVRPTPRSIA